MSSDRTQTAGGPDTVVGQVALAPRHEAPFEIGSKVAGRYTIVRFLGRGGMGEVYEAEDRELRRRLALKVLFAARFGEERAMSMLRGEIAAARKVTHPNVCRVFDLSTHRDEHGRTTRLCSMELLEGETLGDRIARRGRMTEDEARPIVLQLCAGLAAAHAAGVVHRDFKPHNVMLCGGRAVILDFGLATAIDGEPSVRATEIMGTPGYMAPEQLAGDTLTRAVDVYALGVTVLDIVASERWDAIVDRCLAHDPAARPALDEIVAAIRAPASPRRGLRRRRLAMVATSLVAVGGAGALAFATMQGGAEPRPIVARRFSTGVAARIVELRGPGHDKIEDAVHDARGNLYLAGHAGKGAHLGDVPLSTPDVQHGLVVKIGADDRLQWSRTFSSNTKLSVGSLGLLGDRVIIGGTVHRGGADLGDGPRTVQSQSDGFVMALSASDGRVLWRRVLASTTETLVRHVAIGPDGNIYVAGDHAGHTEFGDDVRRNETPSPFVATYTPDGALRWVVAGTGGTNTRGRVLAFAGELVILGGTSAGTLEMGGLRWSPGVERGGFVAAFDRSSGASRWVVPFLTSGDVWGIVPANDGTVRVSGAFAEEMTLIPGKTLVAPPLKLRPVLVTVDVADGRVARAVALDGGDQATWSGRILVALPGGRWLVAGAFEGELAVTDQRFRSVGENDGYAVIVDDDGTIVDVVLLGGPDGERFRRAAWIAPDRLAMWGRQGGLRLGEIVVESAGQNDGVYAEMRLEALFR